MSFNYRFSSVTSSLICNVSFNSNLISLLISYLIIHFMSTLISSSFIISNPLPLLITSLMSVTELYILSHFPSLKFTLGSFSYLFNFIIISHV